MNFSMSYSEDSTKTVTPLEANVNYLRNDHKELKGIVVSLNDRLRGVEDEVRELNQLIKYHCTQPQANHYQWYQNSPQPYYPHYVQQPPPTPPPMNNVIPPPKPKIQVIPPPSPMHHELPPPSLMNQDVPPPPKCDLPPPTSSPTPKPQPYIEEDSGLSIEVIKSVEVCDEKGSHKEDVVDRVFKVGIENVGIIVSMPKAKGEPNPKEILEWFSEKGRDIIVFKVMNYKPLRWENLKRVKMKGLGV